MEHIKLNNGVCMPALMLGTFPMKGWAAMKTVFLAAKYGYTGFDTASAYDNERYIGRSIKCFFIKRENIFITTKVSNRAQRTGNIRKALESSLKSLKTDHVDLYLMHWPNPDTYIETWRQMEDLYENGLCRAIGVSNFNEHHLDKLLSIARITPAVNQFEIHPLLSQKKLINYCKSLGIATQAYSPLARMDDRLMKNKTILDISEKYNAPPTQIILRWDYQCGNAVVCKTQNPARLKSNIDIFNFTISQEDIEKIDALNADIRVRHDPDNCDFSKL